MCEGCIQLVAKVCRELSPYQREQWAKRHLPESLRMVGLNESVRGGRPDPGPSRHSHLHGVHAFDRSEVRWSGMGGRGA